MLLIFRVHFMYLIELSISASSVDQSHLTQFHYRYNMLFYYRHRGPVIFLFVSYGIMSNETQLSEFPE